MGRIVTIRSPSGTPWRVWNSQNDESAASLRFTLDSAQWWSAVGSTVTFPSRACGGSRSQPTNPATSSSVTDCQSSPQPVR